MLVDLKRNFYKSGMMDIVNEDDGEMRTEVVHIRHDYVPKYYYDCKMQGHT